MADHGCNLLYMAGMAVNGWKWLWKWLDMAGKTGNGLKWLSVAGMSVNGWNGWKWL